MGWDGDVFLACGPDRIDGYGCLPQDVRYRAGGSDVWEVFEFEADVGDVSE